MSGRGKGVHNINIAEKISFAEVAKSINIGPPEIVRTKVRLPLAHEQNIISHKKSIVQFEAPVGFNLDDFARKIGSDKIVRIGRMLKHCFVCFKHESEADMLMSQVSFNDENGKKIYYEYPSFNKKKVYVSNVPLGVTDAMLMEIFAPYGKIEKCNSLKNSDGIPTNKALMLIDEEVKIPERIGMDYFGSTAVMVVTVSGRLPTCWGCSKNGHMWRNCPERRVENLSSKEKTNSPVTNEKKKKRVLSPEVTTPILEETEVDWSAHDGKGRKSPFAIQKLNFSSSIYLTSADFIKLDEIVVNKDKKTAETLMREAKELATWVETKIDHKLSTMEKDEFCNNMKVTAELIQKDIGTEEKFAEVWKHTVVPKNSILGVLEILGLWQESKKVTDQSLNY